MRVHLADSGSSRLRYPRFVGLGRHRSPVLVWGQAPIATGTGKCLAGLALTQIEQVAPGLKKRVDRWLLGFAVADPPASNIQQH